VCYRAYPEDILVRVGSSTLNEGGFLHEVTKVIAHAEYGRGIETDYDIALLKVRILIIPLSYYLMFYTYVSLI
jgi:hypothetical protein